MEPIKRTPVNPWPWSLEFGFNQAEILEGGRRQLVCAGQTAVDANGQPQHQGDMRGQMTLALANLNTVLAAAAMEMTNVTRLVVYTTDMDATMQHYDVLGATLGSVGATPPMTLLGVNRLAMADLMFEIEATAAD